MRLLKLLTIVLVLGGTGWVAKQSVHVETNDREVQITIDRQRLREAGANLKQRGRNAVGIVGRAIERAGDSRDAEDSNETLPVRRILTR